MNANFPPQTPTINQWLAYATKRLADVGITSARLDAEIILAFVLNKQRPFLHAHPELVLNNIITKTIEPILESRSKRVPVAYLIGKKEFYGREFIVNKNVLIPRPESEDIISLLKSIICNQDSMLIDVGTGSGCLGITAKLELPTLGVILTDTDSRALKIAKKNAGLLNADVIFKKSDLLESFLSSTIHPTPTTIIANLPYVDVSWERSPETDYEPSNALFADDGGLALIKKLIEQSSKLLQNNGNLILEADPTQHTKISEFAKNYSFTATKKLGYAIALTKRFDTNTVK